MYNIPVGGNIRTLPGAAALNPAKNSLVRSISFTLTPVTFKVRLGRQHPRHRRLGLGTQWGQRGAGAQQPVTGSLAAAARALDTVQNMPQPMRGAGLTRLPLPPLPPPRAADDAAGRDRHVYRPLLC